VAFGPSSKKRKRLMPFLTIIGFTEQKRYAIASSLPQPELTACIVTDLTATSWKLVYLIGKITN
jgi:hypothetical protein